MQAYQGNAKLKELFVKEIEAHRLADQIIQGTYEQVTAVSTWKGCAIGCSINSLNLVLGKRYKADDHSAYEEELGIPEWLAHLEEMIFENLDSEEARRWPGRFAEAIPVGADLEPVKWKIVDFVLNEKIECVRKNRRVKKETKEKVIGAIQEVLAVFDKARRTGVWIEETAGWAWLEMKIAEDMEFERMHASFYLWAPAKMLEQRAVAMAAGFALAGTETGAKCLYYANELLQLLALTGKGTELPDVRKPAVAPLRPEPVVEHLAHDFALSRAVKNAELL